jgi:pimeloyl-ACP methyl ester carboxylesterase
MYVTVAAGRNGAARHEQGGNVQNPDSEQRKEIGLAAGPIRYREAGSGPPIVFVHGYLVDGRLWDGVVDFLADRFHCFAPDWPLGAQQKPMSPAADLSPPGLAAIVADFLERLDLEDVTIVGNDSGGAVSQILVANHPERIGRLVLTNCDTHENFPPGIFKALPPLARVPGAVEVLALPMRLGAVGRLAFKPFARTTVAPELIASWSAPVTSDKEILRDLRKVTAGMDKRHTLAAAERLRGSRLPILLAWAPGDRFFPMRYPERLAGEVGNARIVQIEGSKTFVPIDQPARLGAEIAQFAGTPAGA